MAHRPLILFEDDRAGRFEPVALTRSVASLRTGAWTHRERWEHVLPGRRPGLVVRRFLAETETASGQWVHVNDAPGDDDVLFVAASLGRPPAPVSEAIRALEPARALVADGRLVAARATGEAAVRLAASLAEAVGEGPFPARADIDWPRRVEELGLRPADLATAPDESLVDLIAGNAAAIGEDFGHYAQLLRPPDPADHPGIVLLAPDRIRLGEGVELDPGVVLDAREGPILLGPRVRVGAHSVLTGPVAAGSDCVVKPLSRLADGVSLGPVCKVGGEVDATIVQGWSNKQHDGFLGHSYLGAWVNLGAATDTSDLKNDYGPVRIVLAGAPYDTGSAHVGSLVGDHSKTAIHTRLNTGTVVGVSANVFGAGVPPQEIPSFTWGAGGPDWQEYRLGKAVRVARVVTARRRVAFGEADERLLARVHAATAARRSAVLGLH